MIEIRKILCPTDFSEFSHRALDLALELAKWYEAEVSVVHVIPRVLMPPEEFPYIEAPQAVGPAARERALSELGRFVHDARAKGVTTEVVLEEGETVTAILEFAKKLPADLVVMGTHGRSGLERLVLGSVTEKLLRKARAPVVTVPRAGTAHLEVPPAPFKKILCPLDFSISSVRALDYAFSLAEESDARLTLLHVLEFVPDTEYRDGVPETILSYRKALEKEALERLRKAVPDEVRRWCEPEERVATGRPYREILKFAGENGVELIVMGVAGRGALDLMVFGSTAQYVVREAKCPVLTVRAS